MNHPIANTLALLVASSSLFSPSMASAFEQTMTCNQTGQYACVSGEEPLPVQWDTACIIYHINETGTQDTDLAKSFEAIQNGFNIWGEPSCTNIEASFGGFTNETRIGYKNDPDFQNANIVIFIDEGWQHSSGILALTSVTFKPSDGIIKDADIELNSAEFRFSTTNYTTQVGIDVANTIAHEAGHFLGLDHSDVAESTMFFSALPGETKKRNLEDDDVNGICAIYPDNSDISNACLGAPVGYFDKETAQSTSSSTSSCRVAATHRATSSGVLPALSLFLFGALFFRRRH